MTISLETLPKEEDILNWDNREYTWYQGDLGAFYECPDGSTAFVTRAQEKNILELIRKLKKEQGSSHES